MGSRFVGLIVLGLVRVLAWTYYFAPLPLQNGMAGVLGRLLWRLKIRRSVVRENIQRVWSGLGRAWVLRPRP